MNKLNFTIIIAGALTVNVVAQAFGDPISCSQVSQDATIGMTCLTSMGAKFKKILGPKAFGIVWQDQDNTIWSTYQGEYDNTVNRLESPPNYDTPAAQACSIIGGTLPLQEQFHNLAGYFERDRYGRLTSRARLEIQSIFPDSIQNDGPYWMSPITYEYDPGGNCFNAYSAEFFHCPNSFPGFKASVRCVANSTL